MISTHIKKEWLFTKRMIALVLCSIMVTMVIPFGSMFSAFAADGDQQEVSFVFTNKLNAGISGIEVQLTGTNEEPNITAKQSGSDGKVTFTGLLEAGTYDYTINVGETKYIAPSNGSITVGSTKEDKGIRLFAPTPFITTQPTPNTQLLEPGTNALYTVAATATLGSPTYTWMKSDTIVGMGETLNISDITAADAGEYICRVSTDLSADDAYIDSNTVTLQVKEAPSISLSANPGNNAEFASALTIEATVSELKGTPKGKIEFYYGLDTKIDEANLIGMKASITINPILLKSSDTPYEIWAKYVKAGDETTYIDSTMENSQKLSYTIVKATPDSTVHYAVTGTVGKDGWYVSDMTILPIFPFVAVGKTQSTGASILTINTESANGSSSLYLGNNADFTSSTTELSAQATFNYKMDKTAPSEPTKNGGNWHWNFMNGGYPITLSSNDTISGVAKFTYSYDGKPEKEIVAKADGTAIIYLSDSNRPRSYYKPKLSQLVVHSYDKAGNKSGQSVLVADKEIELSYDNQYLTHTVDSSNQDVARDSINSSTRFIYNSKTTVTLTADAAGFTSESAIVTLNNEYQNLTWVTADDKIFTTTLELLEGNNQISINAPGYVVTSNEIEYNLKNDSYTSNIHTVDITNPIMNVTYTPETSLLNTNIFVSDRTMTVSIEDKNFRPNELIFTDFKATDSDGTSLNNVAELEDNLLAALKNATWTVEGDMHSASTIFSAEANYEFMLGYQDLANNPVSYATQTFAIDKTAPANLKVKYHTNPISTMVSALTFGFYKPSVTVELYADDATSGVDYFNWTYIQEDGTSATLNVPMETAKLSASDTGKTATAQFTLTADEFKQYRGTINFIASDNAGNVSTSYNGPMYDSTDDSKSVDVLVVDTIAPKSVVTFTEPTQIRDKDSMALYTGDKAAYVNVEGANSILYYTTSVTATIKITEANFYPEDVKVKINGDEYSVSDWTQTLDTDMWTGTIIISDAGNYVVTMKYTDKSDNAMTSYQSSKIYIDGIPPTVDKVDFVPATSDDVVNTTKFLDKLEYGFYFKTAFLAKINVSDSDPSSGLDNISYRLVPYENGVKQTQTIGTATITEGVATISIPAGFKGQIFVEAFDNTRNTSGEKTTQAYVIDDTAPDISVDNNKNTTYRDAAGNKLYVTDISVTVTITDNVSGIKEIGYSQSSEKDTFTRKNNVLENTGYSVGYHLGDGWSVAAMDENLVTKVTKTFVYNSDNNDIILTFDATDRSGNQKQNVTSDKITVDKTAPIINITFRDDDDTDVYYNTNRIADISIIERNFNATLMKAAIENQFGNIPTLNFTDKSITEHTMVIDFDEGDYTFDMSGTDRGNHNATVNYNGGNEKLFYVDKTKPVMEENFTTFSNSDTKNSFNANKTATIKATEHNFDPALINLRITRKGAGQEHNNTGLVDVTQQLLNGVNWVNNGDIHTITFTVSTDAVYQIEIAPSDLAGNTSDNRNTNVFEIDKTAPILSVPEDRKANIYVKPTNDEPSATVTFEDNNIKEIKYVITSYNFNKKENGAYEFVVVKGVDSTVQGATVDLPAEYFEKDGIYEIKADAYDYAGNNSGQKMYTYVVIRNTAVLAYIPDTDLEKFDNIGTRAMDFDDIPIYVYSANEEEITLKIGDTLLSNDDYTLISQKAFLNRVDEYQLAIPQSYISRMFNEDQQVYDMPLNILNESGQLLTLGRMVVDNVKPFGEFEDGMKSGKGYYNVNSKDVQIIRISDDIDETTTKVIVNNQEVDFVYDADNKTITFTLENSPAYGHPWAGHVIKVTLFDTAGNEYSLFESNNVYVGNWFYRFWIFFSMGGLAIIVGVLLLWKPWRKKEED